MAKKNFHEFKKFQKRGSVADDLKNTLRRLIWMVKEMLRSWQK